MHQPLRVLLLSRLLAAIAPPHAQVADKAELATLHREDQRARQDVANLDWAVVSREDAERRARVLAVMRSGALRTATDHDHAAMVFQHRDVSRARLHHGTALEWPGLSRGRLA